MSTEIIYFHENFGEFVVKSEAVPRVGERVWLRDGGRGPEYVVTSVGYELSRLHEMVICHVALEVAGD